MAGYNIPNSTYANVTIATGAGLAGGTTYTTLASNGTSTTPIWTTAYQSPPKVSITEEDITIHGKSLGKAIRDLEERLAILVPNPEIEKEFEKLAEIRREYMAMEAEIKEKMKSWDILKNQDTK